MYTTKITDEEGYRKKLRSHFDSILKGWLISMHPFEVSEDSIMNSIPEFNDNIFIMKHENYISWLTIDEIRELDWNWGKFDAVSLKMKYDKPLLVNCSHFIYKMSPYKASSDHFAEYDSQNAYLINRIDEKVVDPYLFFAGKKGEKLLVRHYTKAVTSFDKIRNCFNFAYENIKGNIRRFILKAQEIALQEILQDPTEGLPITECVMIDENNPNDKPYYFASTDSGPSYEITSSIALEIFRKEFSERYKNRLEEVRQEINNYC